MEWHNGRKQKRKIEEAYGIVWLVTPLGRMGNSKMSGEEHALTR